MLKNAMGASPFSYTAAFSCAVSVFMARNQPNTQASISVENVKVYEGDGVYVKDIYMQPNQTLNVEIDQGGSVFLSIIEENLKLLGGVAIASVNCECDGAVQEFDLPTSLAPANVKAEVSVSLDGIEIDFKLSNDKMKVVFDKAPYEKGTLKITLIKPQEHEGLINNAPNP